MTVTDTDIGLMTLEEKLALRKRIQGKISEDRKNKNLRVTSFIPASKISDFNLVRDWAFEQGFMPKNTNWAFTKFAVLNMIDLLLTEMRTQEQNKQIFNQNTLNQIVPNVDINTTTDPNNHQVTNTRI